MAQIEIKIVADTIHDAVLLWRVGQAIGAPEVVRVRPGEYVEIHGGGGGGKSGASGVKETVDVHAAESIAETEQRANTALAAAEPAKRRGRPPKEKPPAEDSVLAAELAANASIVEGSGPPLESGAAAETVTESQSGQVSSAPANVDLFTAQVKEAIKTDAPVDLLTPKTIVEKNKEIDEGKKALADEANGDITLAVLQAKATSILEKSGAKFLVDIVKAHNDGNSSITSLPAEKYAAVYAAFNEALA